MSRSGFIASLRVSELRRLFDDRYPAGIPDDDAGRDDVELMLCHMVQLRDAPFAIDNFIAAKAPWLTLAELEAVKQRVSTSGHLFTADQLAARLSLTFDDRRRLGITTIGAVDKSASQRAEIQREKHREREKRRRRAEQRQLRRGPVVSKRALVVLDELPPCDWHSVAYLQGELISHPAFAGVGGPSMRKIIARALKELEAQRLVTTEKRPGARGLSVLYATRDERTARKTVPRDNDGDKVTCEALK